MNEGIDNTKIHYNNLNYQITLHQFKLEHYSTSIYNLNYKLKFYTTLAIYITH
jgi:hypothetical protein